MALVVFLAVIAASLIPLPYVVMSPGPAFDVLAQTKKSDGSSADLIAISGHETYRGDGGSLDFTTVRLRGGPGSRINGWTLVDAWRRGYEILPVDAVYPSGATADQVQDENQAMMTSSQDTATAVALKAANISYTTAVTIASVSPTAPAAAVLKAGDRIDAADGTALTSADVLRAAIAKHAAGSAITLQVHRGNDELTLQVPTTTNPQTGATMLGVVLGLTHTFPFPVTIDAGNVGGPSAGLMFSLGIYDLLTPGSLTGGQKVAGTGTIAEDGTVGPIGGIREKVVGAQQQGATWFLAPQDDCTEVAGHVPDGITVVPVATFTDAMTVLGEVRSGSTGGLPHC